MTKRKGLSRVLAFTMALSLLTSTASAYGSDDDFIGDGTGGDYLEATAGDFWNGAEGVRVSVVSATAPYETMAVGDFTNINPMAIPSKIGPVEVSYFGEGQQNKFQLQGGFTPATEGYSFKNPSEELPSIIDTNINDVREHFLDKGRLDKYCEQLGVSSAIIYDGSHNLVIEPIAYFVFGYTGYALTATECAYENQYMTSTVPPQFTLRKRMGSLTHLNLPLCAYLPVSYMDIPTHSGSSGYMDDAYTIERLGICILIGSEFGDFDSSWKPTIKPGEIEGPDDKPVSSGGVTLNPTDALIPADYLNLAIKREVSGDSPSIRVPYGGTVTSGPDMTSSSATQSFSTSSVLDGFYNLFEWGMKDRMLIDRNITAQQANKLATAGQVHSSTPGIVSWLGSPNKSRPEKERVYNTYQWVGVNGHIEPIEYTYDYEYSYDDGEYEDGSHSSSCAKDCTSSHRYWDSDWVTRTGTSNGTYSVVVTGFNYSSKNTAFNDPKNASIVSSNKLTFDKAALTANYTGVVAGSDATFKFFPYYAMNYYPSSASSPSKLWMLASGERSLSTKDVFDVSVKMGGRVSMIAPWSRDKQDINSKPDTVRNVLKSGSAVQVIPKPMEGTLTYTYYAQDPGFIGSPGTMEIKPSAIQAFEKMFSPDAMDAAVYSNVPYTGSLLDYNPPLDLAINNGIVSPGIASSYKQKPRPGALSMVKSFDKNSIKVTVTRNDVISGKQATCMSNIPSSVSIAGRTVPVTQNTGLFSFMDVKGNMNASLLQHGKDTNGVSQPWYKEEYEGLVKVTITGKFKMTENVDDQTWFEVYPHISDWLSGYNTVQNNFNTSDGVPNNPIYRGTDYIMGIGIAINPECTPNGNSIFIPNPGYAPPFQIRGSVFDNTR